MPRQSDFDGDAVIAPEFRSLIESDDPYEVSVVSNRSNITERTYFYAYVNFASKAVWRSGSKKSPDAAISHAHAMVKTYREIAMRRILGMAEPSVQIAYGIEEGQRNRKARHG